MAQYARPSSDISQGGWTDEGTVDNDGNLYTSIDEATIDNDDSYVNGTSSATTFKIKLSTVVDPEVDTGHSLRIFLYGQGTGAAERTDWELVQGDPSETSIATLSNLSNDAPYADVGRALTTGEVANITDYSDLYIKCTNDNISGSEWVRITQVYLETPDEPGVLEQQHYRVRYDLDALNSEGSGWIGALDTDVTANAGVEIRIRYEIVETASRATNKALKFQGRKGAGSWTDLTYQLNDGSPTPTAVPGFHITDSAQYNDGAATTNLLSGSGTGFVAGTGEEDNTVPGVALNNQHTEYEVTIVIHTFYDGPGQNDDGDTFQFRMVESDGTLLGGSYVTPTITLNIPDGYIGGCMVETPYDLGPICDGNGNLYTVIEASHVDPGGNLFLMLKSDNGGKQWSEMDGANRPTTQDLEAVDVKQVGDTLHIVHQRSTSNSVVYHRFRTSDHPTNPDTYEITDESIAAAPGGGDQGCCLEPRDDGTFVAFYNGNDGTYNRVFYKIRSYPGETWGSQNSVDATAATNFWYPTCVKGASNRIHIFYSDEDAHTIYHKSLSSGDSLGSRDSVETDPFQTGGGAVCRSMSTPVYWDSSGNEKIMVVVLDNTSQDIHSVVVTDDGTPEARKTINDAGNIQGYAEGGKLPPVVIDVDGTVVHCVFIDVTPDVMYDKADDDGGWGTNVELEASIVDDTWLVGKIFVHSSGNGGDKVFGYIRDESTGGTGKIWYKEYVLEAGTFPLVPGRVHKDQRNVLLRM
jgi:hypothetical protein